MTSSASSQMRGQLARLFYSTPTGKKESTSSTSPLLRYSGSQEEEEPLFGSNFAYAGPKGHAEANQDSLNSYPQL